MRYLLIVLLLFIGCDDDPVSPEPVYGCTVPSACNFNPNATIFDDSCYYIEDWEDECGVCDLELSNDCVQDECDIWGGDNSTCTSTTSIFITDSWGNQLGYEGDEGFHTNCPNVSFISDGAEISNIFPNPFVGSTSIDFVTNYTTELLIKIINQDNEEIDILYNQFTSGGNSDFPTTHTIDWDGSDSEGNEVLDGYYRAILINDIHECYYNIKKGTEIEPDVCFQSDNDTYDDGYHCGDFHIIEEMAGCVGQECVDLYFYPNSNIAWLSDLVNLDYYPNVGNRVMAINLNSIESIPNNIGDLDYLYGLILNGAQLNSIPESICDIDGLPDEFCQSEIALQTGICNQSIVINLSNNNLCEEYHYECITNWEPQDQSICQNLNIRGYVYDNAGTPIENAYIFLGYEILEITRPPTTISFDMSQDGNVNMWVENECDEIVSTIVDNEFFEAGGYTETWDSLNSDGLMVLDGVYELNTTLNDDTFSTNIMLLKYPPDNFIDGEPGGYEQFCFDDNGELLCEHAALTNSNGYFEFSQDCISLNHEWTGTDEFGNEIGNIGLGRIRLFADDGQEFGTSNFFEVDPYNGAETNIIIGE